MGCFQHRAGPGKAGHPIPSNSSYSCLNDSAAIPTGYDTNKCQKILNKKTCTYTVVEKKDPGKTCDVTGWVL